MSTARFVHMLILNILKCMTGKGVLDPTEAYFGTVENQGWVSFYWHAQMWLDHEFTPSPSPYEPQMNGLTLLEAEAQSDVPEEYSYHTL